MGSRRIKLMNVQKRVLGKYTVAFLIVLIGYPLAMRTIPFNELFKENFGVSVDGLSQFFITFFIWPLVLSVLLHFRVFCGFSGKGPGKIWLPVFISHTLIFPGLFGWLIVFRLGGAFPISGGLLSYYFAWGIAVLIANFWLQKTKPFEDLNIEGNQFRYFTWAGLVFFPIFFNIMLGYISLINSNI